MSLSGENPRLLLDSYPKFCDSAAFDLWQTLLWGRHLILHTTLTSAQEKITNE